MFELFEPFKIRNVEFGNRVVRSSIGGRMAYYDGRVSPAWVAFEKRFAAGGVAAIISATISINKDRMSPLEYPTIHSDDFVGPLRDAVQQVKAAGTGRVACRYIMQIGDTGGHTHTSLFPQSNDALSASSTFDFLYGYCNRTIAMTEAHIEASIAEFAAAARRVVAIGCDGVEVTASKGYLIQQFLNPATNRRRDRYGGSVDNRFRFLSRVVEAVRKEVGPDFLFGVRLSAKDYNYLPVNIRLPPVWNLRHYFMGNTLRETTYYAKRLEELGVDYLHVDSGFGFLNPKGSPGAFPDVGFKIFANANRHLSGKAQARAIIFNLFPAWFRRRVFGLGWRVPEAANADLAATIKRAVSIPVIANGGFQKRKEIDDALSAGKCDMVAIARPLLANPDLLKQLEQCNEPKNPCTFCSLCCARTAVFPLGCYDVSRFDMCRERMLKQIMEMSSPEWPTDVTSGVAGPGDGGTI
ncbi:MAG TPA: NADH:flavin oxidoreductase [Hyphomicrobiaceae bacterium]|jgi:2,4-dienoyl-CoA reductase (NADPH2)|nr:NADH:flavin oxidoreductase [Hyphomicrobiaceae bacterium]